MDGKQAALAAAVGKLQGDLEAHSTALEGIGATCTQLLQVCPGALGTPVGSVQRHATTVAACAVPHGMTQAGTRCITIGPLPQAVQSIGGASDGIAARLQQLLAKQPAVVTGGAGLGVHCLKAEAQ